MPEKVYLGDSVYAEFNDTGAVILTTENGYGPSNTIYLEPEVYNALVKMRAEKRLVMPETTTARRQVAERLVLEHAPRYAGESRLVDAIEAALKDRDDEIERLREQLNDPCLVAGYHVCGGVHDLSKRSW